LIFRDKLAVGLRVRVLLVGFPGSSYKWDEKTLIGRVITPMEALTVGKKIAQFAPPKPSHL